MGKKCYECGSTAKEQYFCCVVCDKTIDYKCFGIKSKATFDLVCQLKNLRYICDDCDDVLKFQMNLFSKMTESFNVINQNIHDLQSDLISMSSKLNNNKNRHNTGTPNSKNINNKNKTKDNTNVSVAVSQTNDQLPHSGGCNVQSVAVSNILSTITTNGDCTNQIKISNIDKCNTDEPVILSKHSSMYKNKAFQSKIPKQDVIFGTSCSITSIGAVPPRKWIFVSRLKPTITDNEFKEFVKNNLLISDAYCTRINKDSQNGVGSSYISYKISVPLESYEVVMNADAWPEHVLIKEFNFNQNRGNFRSGRRLSQRIP